jgi:hypothetical protein
VALCLWTVKHIPAGPGVWADGNTQAWCACVAVTAAFMEEAEPKTSAQLDTVSVSTIHMGPRARAFSRV